MANLSKAGLNQGDMAPKVEDIQKPMSSYSQSGFSKTLDYVERKNAFENAEAKEISKQAYKGRYS